MDSGASRSGSAHAGAQRALHVTRDAMEIDRSDRNDTPGRPKNNERKSRSGTSLNGFATLPADPKRAHGGLRFAVVPTAFAPIIAIFPR
jgi:hypothetical protein